MRKLLNCFALFFPVLLSSVFATAQNLTPQELIRISDIEDLKAISNTLNEKGFELSQGFTMQLTKETTSRWSFTPFEGAGEKVSAFLSKTIDSTRRARIVYVLYNPFYYKEFIGNLIRSAYKLEGIKIIDRESYFVFRNHGMVFLTREKQAANKESYFEILLQSDQDGQ